MNFVKLFSSGTSEESPMEIDRMQYEKGKGKKGKDGQKGKGKKAGGKDGKSKDGKGKTSTWSTSTWSTGKGKKGDSKGKGHGTQDNKGKGKGQSEERRCFWCNGVGHVTNDCRNNVRQVEETMDSSTSYRSSSSQQRSAPPSSTSSTSLPSSTLRVARIVEEPRGLHGVPVFDMREAHGKFSSDDSNVRVLQYILIGDTDPGEDHMVRAVIEEINGDSMEEEEHDEPVTMILDSGADAPAFPASRASAGEHR